MIIMEMTTFEEFNDILEPLGANSAKFFLAASLYHAGKVSFHRAAELAGLSFEAFNARLMEHFSTGFIISDETVSNDLDTVQQLLSD